MCSILSNKTFPESNLTISRGMSHKFNNNSSRTNILFQTSAICVQYLDHTFKQCLIVFGFEMRIFRITTRFNRRAAHTKESSVHKTWLVVLEQYHIMHSKKMCNWKGHILRACIILHLPYVLHSRTHWVKRALRVEEGSCLT